MIQEPTPRPAAAPILALDVESADDALSLVERVGDAADFVKVGLQLFTAAGPQVVRELKGCGRRIFLDLKLHDIPNTVARAVESAAELGVELLTLHASGGATMMRAAREAAGAVGSGGPEILAVTVLTSLDAAGLAEAWGREPLGLEAEVQRLAALAAESGMDGVVASVHEIEPIRAHLADRLKILTPGIRFAGDERGDQTRVATPAEAARLGADYLVIGRAVTAAADPRAAYQRVLEELSGARAGGTA
jgi:orotidine-5'-phosphate decarboxylase